jgi:hypothetical protein
MDNRYFNYGCPALMQDARFITNYHPHRSFEQHIRSVNNLGSAQDYKLFLQKNGDTIMNKERAYLAKINTCEVGGKCVPMGKNPDHVIAKSCGCTCKQN